MASPIAEYLISLGFKLDDPAYKRFNETLDRTGKNFAHFGATATEAALAVGIAVEKVASNYQDLFFLSQRTGAGVQNLQAMAFGFSQIGLSAGDAKGVIDSFSMALRNPGLAAYALALGVTGKDAVAQHNSFIRQLSKKPDYIAFQIAGMFGESQMQYLQEKNNLPREEAAADELKRLQDLAGLNAGALSKSSDQFEQDLGHLEATFGVLKDTIANDFIAPADTVIKTVDRLTQEFLAFDVTSDHLASKILGVGSALGGIVALRASLGWLAGLFGGKAAAVAETAGVGPTAVTSGAVAAARALAARAGFAAATIDMAEGSGNKAVADMIRKLDAERGLSDKPEDVLKDILGTLKDIRDKDQPFGGLADVNFGGAANPYNRRGGAGQPEPSPADAAALTRAGQSRAGWWTPDREQHAIQTLVAGGVSPLGAAALASRWKNVESGGGPGSVNPTSGAFGIGQWLGTRKPGIAGDTDFDHQLAYTLAELHSSQSRAFGLLNSAQSPWDAARGATEFEKAHGYNPATSTDDFTRTTALGIAGVKTPVTSAPPTAPATPPPWGALDPFATSPANGATQAAAIPVPSYLGGSPALGSDSKSGDRNVTVNGGPTTITVSGGADPKSTADYVLKGQGSVNADIVRNAGATVR